MKRDNAIRAAVFVALVGVAVAVRLVSETPNFNAVTAAALFAGFFFRSRLAALCVPLLAMAISDQFLGGYARPVMVAVYASLAVPIFWRSVLRRKLSALSVGGAAATSSLAFFVVTNAAVWYFWYPLTWEGLLLCYGKALPFMANALAGDLLFSAGFFGLYALATSRAAEPVRRLAVEPVA